LGTKSATTIAALVTLSTLTGYLTRVNISVALPFISEDYGWTSQERALFGGVLLGLFLVGYGLSNIFVSPLIDRFGPRKGLMAIMLVWSIITFFTGIIGLIFWLFLLFRIILGLSEGPLFPSASKFTQAWFDVEGRTRVNSFWFSALYLSNLMASVTLVPLILLTSWQWAFYSIGILGIFVLIPLYLFLQDTPQGPVRSTADGTASAGTMVNACLVQVRGVLKLKGIVVLALSDITTNLAWWGISLWLPTYLIAEKGFDLSQLTYAVALPYVGGLLGIYVGSWISRRTQKVAATASVFAVLSAAFILLMTLVNSQASTIVVMAGIFFFISIVQPNLITLLQGNCPSNLIGGATGFLNGISVGLGVFGPITIGVTVAITGSFSLGLVILAAFQLLSGVVLLLFWRRS